MQAVPKLDESMLVLVSKSDVSFEWSHGRKGHPAQVIGHENFELTRDDDDLAVVAG